MRDRGWERNAMTCCLLDRMVAHSLTQAARVICSSPEQDLLSQNPDIGREMICRSHPSVGSHWQRRVSQGGKVLHFFKIICLFLNI